MAADRARVTAKISGDALTAAESARNLAVLARKAGWHSQALSIALTAADAPGLHSGIRACTAERGLLIQFPPRSPSPHLRTAHLRTHHTRPTLTRCPMRDRIIRPLTP
jgi:hypothetical protein